MSKKNPPHLHQKLGQFASTAIAGNDILSSCLYVSGIAILFAGIYAPYVFIAVAAVLFLYKHVYTEVVEALPLNGGAYNCLLNASSKSFAAVAGVMTILSYVATSVISAKTASEYLHTLIHSVPVMPLTAGIIIAFAVLTALGVKDSAKVAIGIFVFHLFTLTIFITLGLMSLINNGWGELPGNLLATNNLFSQDIPIKMIFFAFAASLLGVSGFESSSNFVEEQERGVFRLTLRNMLLGVLIFNPLITFVLLHLLDMGTIAVAKDFVLSEAAFAVGGQALKIIVVIDAFLVLSGAVLASFVGATGLLYRMTLDHCLPSSILLPKLKRRNQNSQRIIIMFAALCISILFITGGKLLSLAGVYTISFLGVMTSFAIGNLILRKSRSDLKRTYQGPMLFVVFAGLATAIGIIGNIMIDPHNLFFFAVYFIPSLFLVLAMVYRDYLLEWLTNVTKPLPFLHKFIKPLFQYVISNRIVLFTHHPNKLFSALEYIRKNETSRRITIVFCQHGADHPDQYIRKFKEYIHLFNEANIFSQFDISLIIEKDQPFAPETVKSYAQRFRIGRNNVFIGSIHHQHSFSFEDLGGVRIIQ